MKKFNKILLVATALTAVNVTSSMAAENKFYIIQTGDDNVTSIDQTGDGNIFGAVAPKANTGITQQAHDNEIDSDQIGTNNQIGTLANTKKVKSVFQSKAGNSLTVTQQGDAGYNAGLGEDNLIAVIYQLGQASGARTNEANLTQSGKSNEITVVNQKVQNTAAIPANTGNNIATITQTGESNLVKKIDQYNQVIGDDNTLTASFDGTGNGTSGELADTGTAWLGSIAAGATAAESEIIQNGSGNSINLAIVGDYNKYGLEQAGHGNTVGLLSITGEFNLLGIYQGADDNVVSVGAIVGDGNDIGIFQSGSDYASVNLTTGSDNNQVSVTQYGGNSPSGNPLVSYGTYVDIAGSLNGLNIVQDGMLGKNYVKVDISGSSNNDPTLLASFSGEAAIGLTPGDIHQNGTLNSVDLAVTSSSNLFAVGQNGNNNVVVGIISGGGNNQAAIDQSEDGNTAIFSQLGSGNILGSTQSGGATLVN